jgi:hypothetical protein
MLRWGSPVALAAVLGAVAAQKPDGPPAEPVPVERLVGQLGSLDYRTRQAAARALEARGAEALPALRRAAGSADPEARRRITALTQAIERAALVAPKRVTLKLDDRPLKQAVADLARQSGYRVELSAGPDLEKSRLTVRADNVTFWEAVDRIALPGGLGGIAFGGEGDSAITLQRSETFNAFVSYQGAFRLSAETIGRQTTRNLALRRRPAGDEPDGSDQLTLTVAVMSEPKLPMLGTGAARVTEAEDDRGQSLLPPEEPPAEGPPDRVTLPEGQRTFSETTQVTLGRPSPGARTVKRVKGTVPVLLLLAQRPAAVVEPILKAKGRKVVGGGVELTVEEVTEMPAGTYEVKLSTRPVGKSETEGAPSWANSLSERSELQDAEGRKYVGQVRSGSAEPDKAELTIVYTNPGPLGPPAKLVLYDWQTLLHQVEFDFRDIPLP